MANESLIDPDFKGTVFEQLGHSDRLCRYCGAHLFPATSKHPICLNGCHLPHGTMMKMNRMLAEAAVVCEKKRKEKTDGKDA